MTRSSNTAPMPDPEYLEILNRLKINPQAKEKAVQNYLRTFQQKTAAPRSAPDSRHGVENMDTVNFTLPPLPLDSRKAISERSNVIPL